MLRRWMGSRFYRGFIRCFVLVLLVCFGCGFLNFEEGEICCCWSLARQVLNHPVDDSKREYMSQY